MRYAPEWSPDGKRLAFMDKDGKLYVLTLEDKKLVEIADDMLRPRARDSAWSPNGGHLAFSLTGSNNLRSIYIWSVSDGQRRRITSELFDEFDPAWDPEGNYLYYLSRREFAPRESSVEWNYFIDREMGIFTLALRTDVRHPFLPESDEVTVEKEETEEKDKEYIKIDFDGLAERCRARAGSARQLGRTQGHQGTPALHPPRGLLLWPGQRSAAQPADLFDERSRSQYSCRESKCVCPLRVLSEQVVHRSEQVAPNPKEILDESMHRQESLRVPG